MQYRLCIFYAINKYKGKNNVTDGLMRVTDNR